MFEPEVEGPRCSPRRRLRQRTRAKKPRRHRCCRAFRRAECLHRCTRQDAPFSQLRAVRPPEADDRPAGYLARLALVLPLVVFALVTFALMVLALAILALAALGLALAVGFDLGRPKPMRLAISERCSA